ncbi:MAG TPA: helicase, partial [Candidatus Binatia bacterium]|nr:helicase [Candidatus Binatia bacterium]
MAQETDSSIPVRADPREISPTLKEAVADALLNSVIGRLSGRGDYGRVIFGTKPRTAIASGFLLPLDPITDGDEENASIRICSHGLDMIVAVSATGTIRVQPKCALYVRVFPTANEILHHPNCDPKFKLKKEVEKELRKKIRERLKEEVKKLKGGRKDPQWPELDLAIRRAAYAELGIPFVSGATEETTEEVSTEGNGSEEAEVENGVRVSGRIDLPDHLATEAQVPQKWLRLGVELPALEFRLDNVEAAVDASNTAIREAVNKRLAAWTDDADPISGGKLWGYRRSRKIRPSDVKNWDGFLAEIAATCLKVLTPDIRLEWDIETNPDFLNPVCRSVHIAIENRSDEPNPSVYTYKETEQAVFLVSLELSIPKAMHSSLMLDRVEPSYRYYQYLAYPALGYNGGVTQAEHGNALQLRTTWTPRYYQPRIIPSSLENKGVVTNIESLSKPDCVVGLKPLVACFKDWLEDVQKFPFDAGIDKSQTELIARERDQLEQDKARWAEEIAAIETGIAILEESASFWKEPGVPLDKRAAPFEAWLAMNTSMANVAKAKGYDKWRLFQLAFILASLPALVTRMPEFLHRYTAEVGKYANSVTLLYFATGGGKSEAFLGLLVFNLFLDRLRGKERGVTAMLRYPLRLLTMQQAQRTAKTLAMAELVRRERTYPGESFSIGFWVGSSNTPNSLYDEEVRVLPEVTKFPAGVEAHLLESNNTYARAVERWNKLPQCPFCASAKGTGLRRFPALGGLLGHLCLNEDCAWNRAQKEPAPLPFYIVDDDIYELPPSVLLGTVDKLALIGQSQRTIRRFLGMFGFAPGYKADTGRLYSPDPRRKEELSKPQS